MPGQVHGLLGGVDAGDLVGDELDPLTVEAAQVAADLPGDLLAQHDGGIGGCKAVPDVALYQDDAVLAVKQPPQSVGGH